MTSRPTPPYTVAEAMELLGYSRRTIARMLSDGRLTRMKPSGKASGAVRIPAAEVEALVTPRRTRRRAA